MMALGETQRAILETACRQGYFDAVSENDRQACLKLHPKGLLARDPKVSGRFYPTTLANEDTGISAQTIGTGAPTKVATERRIDSIDASGRLRNLDERTVLALMESIGKDGLETPITVYGDVADAQVKLGAGGHRLEAARRLGLDVIFCFHKTGDDLDRQLCEIDENLIRADLTPSDRALFLSRRKEIYLIKFPETANGATGNGRSKLRQIGEATLEVQRFTAATADATGQKERTIQRDVARGDRISKTALQIVQGTRHDKGVTLDQLMKLETHEAQERFAKDLIASDKLVSAESKLIRTVTQKSNREARLRHVGMIAEYGRRKGGEMPRSAYPIGYADPPWEQEAWSDETGQDKGLMYPSMPLDEIKELCAGDKSPFTPDAVLWLWVPFNRIDDGIDVLKAWGFEHVSAIVWDKVDIGMGRWVRDRAEMVLIGKRGRISLAPEMGTQPASLYSEKKGEHSRKPVWFAEQLDALYPDLPKLELFQRKESLAEGDIRLSGNWSFWGFEALEGVDVPAVQTESAVTEGSGLLLEEQDDLYERALRVTRETGICTAAILEERLGIDWPTALPLYARIKLSSGVDLSDDQRKQLERFVALSSDGADVECAQSRQPEPTPVDQPPKDTKPQKSKVEKADSYTAMRKASSERKKAYRSTIPKAISDDDLILAAVGNLSGYHRSVTHGHEHEMVVCADKIAAIADHLFSVDPDYDWGSQIGGGPPKGSGRFSCLHDAHKWLMSKLAAPDGDIPMFGQPGRFVIELFGCRVDFQYDGLFGITGGDACVIDLDKPFFSSTGYRSFQVCPDGYVIHAGGLDVRAYMERVCTAQFTEGGKKKVKLHNPPFGTSSSKGDDPAQLASQFIIDRRANDPAYQAGGHLHNLIFGVPA